MQQTIKRYFELRKMGESPYFAWLRSMSLDALQLYGKSKFK